MQGGVHTLFLAVVTTDLLNFMSSRITATLPLAAAMCAHVMPFYKNIFIEAFRFSFLEKILGYGHLHAKY